MRVLAIGNTIIDTVLTMPSIPIDDKVWVDSKQVFVGGQAANAAQAMARLGLKVSFLTRLGSDSDGAMALDKYIREGMDTSNCIIIPGAQTMSACVTVGRKCGTRCSFMHKDDALFAFDVEPRSRTLTCPASTQCTPTVTRLTSCCRLLRLQPGAASP